MSKLEKKLIEIGYRIAWWRLKHRMLPKCYWKLFSKEAFR